MQFDPRLVELTIAVAIAVIIGGGDSFYTVVLTNKMAYPFVQEYTFFGLDPSPPDLEMLQIEVIAVAFVNWESFRILYRGHMAASRPIATVSITIFFARRGVSSGGKTSQPSCCSSILSRSAAENSDCGMGRFRKVTSPPERNALSFH